MDLWCKILVIFFSILKCIDDCVSILISYRCVTMELASSLVEGANEDLIDMIYKFIRHTLLVCCHL